VTARTSDGRGGPTAERGVSTGPEGGPRSLRTLPSTDGAAGGEPEVRCVVLGATSELAAAVLDDLDVAVWVVDAGTARVVAANATAAADMGLAADELVGTRFGTWCRPPLDDHAWTTLLGPGGPGGHRVAVTLERADGAGMDVELRARRHSDADDDLLVLTARPLSTRIRATSTVTTDRALLDAVTDTLGEGIAVTDRNGRIESVNETFCRLVGVPAERLLHRSVLDPPWTVLDEFDRRVPVEASPPAVTIRTGIAVHSGAICVEGDPGDRTWFRMRAEPLPGPDGSPKGIVVVASDVTETRRAAAASRRLLGTDSLTGLATRPRIAELIESAVREAATPSGARVGVVHVDLDHFRTVNETFGPTAGDTVLVEVASRLRGLEGRRIEIGRVGVDEFLVLMVGDGPSLTFDTRLRRLAEEVQRRVRQPVVVDGLEIRLTASIGVARCPGDAVTAMALMSAADRALVAGRGEGRNQLRFYEATIDADTRAGLALDRDLRRATAQRALEVHYQPIIDLRTGTVAAAEALVRWHHPDQGPVPPSVFIPAAEATGAIRAVSDLVMSTVAEDLAAWRGTDLLPEGARISVNVSTGEFAQRDYVERVAAILTEAGVSPHRVELEITESVLVEDLGAAARRLEQLAELGFLIALDDFGTGYSSLSYLHSLPLNTLKIDRRFVGALNDGRSETVTRAILTLAHNLGIVAVAEGVETESQRSFLTEAGCDLVQGFLFAPPLPRAAFERFLDEGVATAPPVAVSGAH
jgi:diguanylate cyclase (GGDEF)-like protein/PAS domain S-box-containing protein